MTERAFPLLGHWCPNGQAVTEEVRSLEDLALDLGRPDRLGETEIGLDWTPVWVPIAL